jgi:WD40 repeat protein
LQPYDADNQLFAATLRSSGLDLNVHFSVPRDSAPLFKQESIGAIASGRFWLESDENIYQAAPIRVMIGGSEFQTTESGPGIAFLDWRSTPIPGSQYDDSRIAAFEKTGSLAAVGSMQDTYHPQLSLIDMKNGNTNQLDVGRTNAISFSNDGAKLAAYVEGILKIWNLASLQMQYQLSVDKNPIGDFYATVFSPDNQKVAASYGWYNTNALSNVTKGSGVVRVFDMATGKQLWIYEASKDMWPTYVAYSADGKLLAARFAWREKNQRNWKVFIWNTENWQVAQELSSSN